jgi:Flp pilus assembly protein TadB
MTGGNRRPAPTSIGALTRKDRHREAALAQKIDDAYRNFSKTSSVRARHRYLRAARRNERALVAQHRRPQSALIALAVALAVLLGAIVVTGASFTVAVVLAAVLAVDVRVLRHRRRTLRRA